jgi:hypothetical protein
MRDAPEKHHANRISDSDADLFSDIDLDELEEHRHARPTTMSSIPRTPDDEEYSADTEDAESEYDDADIFHNYPYEVGMESHQELTDTRSVPGLALTLPIDDRLTTSM